MFANLRWTSQVSIATCHFLSRLLKLLAAGTPEAAAELTCPTRWGRLPGYVLLYIAILWRWWKSKVKQHSLTLLFIDSISSSLYRVFNPRWKTVITRPDGDSWLQPDWSTVWYYLTFSCCSLHTLHIFTHSLFSLQGDFFMDPSLRRPMQVYIWAESPKTLQTVFFSRSLCLSLTNLNFLWL